ncbi:hypothetical protein HYALB_00004296 [Hymenoscyphus albidus]|uniref:Uncharacterized protein n=1 Tax=Hymenoscyphus albidus TaxID=595503 RepID=A0A9N9M5J7_9HELO|nr:hypothetical protein HYALB_00004296 [Hymenoscyphus albidus]
MDISVPFMRRSGNIPYGMESWNLPGIYGIYGSYGIKCHLPNAGYILYEPVLEVSIAILCLIASVAIGTSQGCEQHKIVYLDDISSLESNDFPQSETGWLAQSPSETVRPKIKAIMTTQSSNVQLAHNAQPLDLWAKALEKLNDDDKALIVLRQNRLDILGDVLSLVRQKEVACQKKRWKWKNRQGETIIIRDVLKKIIIWVEKIKG